MRAPFHFWLFLQVGAVLDVPLRHLPRCRQTSSLRGTVPGSLWALRPDCPDGALRAPSSSLTMLHPGCLVTLRMDCLPWCRQKSHPAHGAVRKPPRELENKKMARIATFLRLRIVVWFQIASRGVKTRIIGHKTAYFRFAGTGKESLIAKKLQRCEGFCFCFHAGAVSPYCATAWHHLCFLDGCDGLCP